jgi:hypothetical protein
VLIVNRRGRAGQVIDLTNLNIERESHIVADKLEARMGKEMLDIGLGSGEEIVYAHNFVPIGQQPVAKMRAKEAGAPGYEY